MSRAFSERTTGITELNLGNTNKAVRISPAALFEKRADMMPSSA